MGTPDLLIAGEQGTRRSRRDQTPGQRAARRGAGQDSGTFSQPGTGEPKLTASKVTDRHLVPVICARGIEPAYLEQAAPGCPLITHRAGARSNTPWSRAGRANRITRFR
jgi:hypothetical protein